MHKNYFDFLKLIILLFISSGLFSIKCMAQNYTFNFNTTGRRVCLVSSEVNLSPSRVKLIFHDSLSNTSEPIVISRRAYNSNLWTNITTIAPGTGHWIDNNVNIGEVWEYQVKRMNTWLFSGTNYAATGYTLGAILNDSSNYKGQMILLVANDIPSNLFTKYTRLKKELTNDGWFVNELIVTKATNWDSGNQVVTIKNQVHAIYTNAPLNDKPKVLFILGHVPMPRCGSTEAVAPDDHSQNKGARGCDGYYADIDGVFTDTNSYIPSGLSTPLALNLPGDSKWDQDFFTSDVELAFGRVDFADLTDISTPEITLIEQYLDRLSFYKNVASGYNMGDKSAFFFGYNNSNDGSYRSLLNISKPQNVIQKTDNTNHNQWVQNNGPFKIYMQNLLVPSISDWQNYGMNATVFSSDQSYWGFGDVPQPAGVYSRIRALLGVNSKCLVALWTTTGLNIFHQACNGQSLAQALKDIINHNASNQYLEKPQQQYDTQDWWNRTHFQVWGDPTINLYQVQPISNLSINEVSGSAILEWSASMDTDIVGYHVYESTSEFGIYEKITNALILGTNFQIYNYNPSNWYMVKAIKISESGCGKFLHPSIGISRQGVITLSNSSNILIDAIKIIPNPSSAIFNIETLQNSTKIKVYDETGLLVLEIKPQKLNISLDLSKYPNGIYFVEILGNDNNRIVKKIIKRN